MPQGLVPLPEVLLLYTMKVVVSVIKAVELFP